MPNDTISREELEIKCAEKRNKAIRELIAEKNRYKEALEKIVNPLQALRAEAEADGCVLSGMAAQVADNPETLKGWAREALQKDKL